jgi:hypothetical protein
MDIILGEFERDLQRVCKQLDLIDALKAFIGLDAPAEDNPTDFLQKAKIIHNEVREVHADLPILVGTLTLYIAGRFEDFSRTLFEDLCQRLAQRADNFKSLPKKMQEALMVYTAVIIQSPRKYGYGDGAAASFIATLNENLSSAGKLTAVNHKCLSITEANMKPDILKELFERIGVSDFWKKIGQQASIQAHFETLDPSEAEKKTKTELTELMDLRNLVAHPSGTINWPSTEKIREYTRFLNVLAKALSDLTSVFEVALCRPAN